jgi:hypothetical protein
MDHMKRIALLICGLLMLVANTAEARRYRRTSGGNYTRPVQVANAGYSTVAAAPAATTPAATTPAPSAEVTQTSYSATPARSTPATPATLSTSTAQGVANIMAAYNRVGHWGGNPGYEGCGCGATPQAAYNICCYANSGMATVDVGYAQSASGMWYCCRRYR